MRTWFQIATLLALALLCATPPKASAQYAQRMDLGANYAYVRANAGPGQCGCFGLNGGSGWFGYNLSYSWAVVAEEDRESASPINGASANLTLSSFMAGPRYSFRRENRIVPFAQSLFGAAHASGTPAPGAFGVAGSDNAFAMAAGGGVDVNLSHHIALRAFQADYYLTRFNNGVNTHQNNLRMNAGIIVRFGGAR